MYDDDDDGNAYDVRTMLARRRPKLSAADYKMPAPPEPELVSSCEANEEWCRLRDAEVEAWLRLQESEHRQHGCEPMDAVRLRKLGKEVAHQDAVSERLYQQGKVRLDRLQLNKNLNEQ